MLIVASRDLVSADVGDVADRAELASPFRHIVVVATVGRDLLRRALDSVAAQVRQPDRLIIVVDGGLAVVDAVTAVVDCSFPRAEVIANAYTPGACGAWNTAMRFLETSEEAGTTLVSILDDDDWWDPGYLAGANVLSGDADVVASAFRRIEAASESTVIPPSTLKAADFLVGNPGIQGSNLTMRLSCWLEVGGFDEHLTSCTDRDLCIRLADIGVRLAVQPAVACNHDTAHGLGRLSDPSPAKRDGLDRFFAKYARRMTPQQTVAFRDRGNQLFGWDFPEQPKFKRREPRRAAPTMRTLKLAVGVIVDGDAPHKAERLMGDLSRLATVDCVGRIDVILLENSSADGFKRVVAFAEAVGLQVWPASAEAQSKVAKECGIDHPLPHRKSIAESRSLLHRFVAATSRIGEDMVAWILDDDMRLPDDLELLASDIQRARDAGFAVAIGTIEGDPPIPVAGAVRTQLVDLVHFLHGVAVHPASEPTTAGERANAAWTANRRDYYHDHPRMETDRLETPFTPVLEASNGKEALQEVGERCLRILAGEQIFRPLAPQYDDPVAAARPHCLRGGNTLVFDLTTLRLASNLSPRLGDRLLRRSDTLWAVHARYRFGRRVVSMPFALKHDRSDDALRPLDHEMWADDILGHAFARAFEDAFAAKVEGGPLELTDADEDNICRATEAHAQQRVAACRVGSYRIRGLADALSLVISEFAPGWWTAEPESASAVSKFRELSSHVRQAFSLDALNELERAVNARLTADGLRAYMTAVVQHRVDPDRDTESFANWRKSVRGARATRFVAHHMGRRATEVLGMGAEGVVVEADGRAIKVFDRWTRAMRAEHLPTLRRLRERQAQGVLPTLFGVVEYADGVALEMELFSGTRYAGGHGGAMLDMLRALTKAGWVHTNVSPKNLMLTPTGLRLVDVGRSLELVSDDGVGAMVRRAWLSWHCAHRPDLAILARKSTSDTNLPELEGWDVLLGALSAPSSKEALDRCMEGRVRAKAPARTLDYGCGKPRPIHEWLAQGELTVFDVEAPLRLRWERSLPEAEFLHADALHDRLNAATRFDEVLCSLVLCVVPNDEATRIVHELRRMVALDGRVLLAICEPTTVHTLATDYQERRAPSGCRYEECFAYKKTVRESAGERTDFHRPLDWYRAAFTAAGFAVVAEETIEGLDLQNFRRVPEFRLFDLEPLPTTGVGSPTGDSLSTRPQSSCALSPKARI